MMKENKQTGTFITKAKIFTENMEAVISFFLIFFKPVPDSLYST